MPQISQAHKNFILSKEKYALAYANGESASWWRKQAFQIKSFLSGDADKDKTLYLRYNYFRLISKAYADYEVGEGIQVQFENTKIQERLTQWMDSSNIQQLIYNVMVQKSKIGHCIVRCLFRDDEKSKRTPIIEKIPLTNYFCSTTGISVGATFVDLPEHHIVNVYNEIINGETKTRAKVDTYRKQGDQWIGEYGTYEYSASFTYNDDNRIGELTTEVLPYLPLFLFNAENLEDDMLEGEDIRNQKGSGLLKMIFAESDYVDVMDIIQDINDRQSQISVEFIKHLGSKISLPESYFERAQNMSINSLLKNKSNTVEAINNHIENFDYISHGAGESPAQYITKDAVMIDKAIDKIEKDIRAISTFTSIPVYMLGLETASGNRHVGTDEKDAEAFLQKIKRRRSIAYATLQQFFAYVAWGMKFEYVLPTIKFPKLPNGDLSVKVDIASRMKDNGFLSQKSLIKFVNNFDDAEYDEEKAIMDQELTDEYAIQGQQKF